MQEDRIRVMLVDHDDAASPGLEVLLAGEPDIDLVAVASSAGEAIALATTARPDVIVMDDLLPDGNGASAAARIRSGNPDINVVLRSGTDDPDTLQRAVHAGCAGCIDSSKPLERVATAIRSAAAGNAVISVEALGRLVLST